MCWAMSGDSVLRVRVRCRRTVPSLIVVSMKLPVTNSIVCVHQKNVCMCYKQMEHRVDVVWVLGARS